MDCPNAFQDLLKECRVHTLLCNALSDGGYQSISDFAWAFPCVRGSWWCGQNSGRAPTPRSAAPVARRSAQALTIPSRVVAANARAHDAVAASEGAKRLATLPGALGGLGLVPSAYWVAWMPCLCLSRPRRSNSGLIRTSIPTEANRLYETLAVALQRENARAVLRRQPEHVPPPGPGAHLLGP